MEWMFTISGKPILRHRKHGNPVQLLTLGGTTTPIKQLSIGESYKTLSTHREPAQSQRKQFRPNIFDFTPLKITPHLTGDSIPVDAKVSPNGLVTNHLEETVMFHLEFSNYVASLPDYDAMLLQRVNFHSRSPHQLYQALLNADTLLLVSDGDADNYIGSTSWVIPDLDLIHGPTG
jgi:hypothetical protein